LSKAFSRFIIQYLIFCLLFRQCKRNKALKDIFKPILFFSGTTAFLIPDPLKEPGSLLSDPYSSPVLSGPDKYRKNRFSIMFNKQIYTRPNKQPVKISSSLDLEQLIGRS